MEGQAGRGVRQTVETGLPWVLPKDRGLKGRAVDSRLEVDAVGVPHVPEAAGPEKHLVNRMCTGRGSVSVAAQVPGRQFGTRN